MAVSVIYLVMQEKIRHLKLILNVLDLSWMNDHILPYSEADPWNSQNSKQGIINQIVQRIKYLILPGSN